MAVPEHLRDRIGKRELKQTLRTTDLREANRLALPVIADFKRTLECAGQEAPSSVPLRIGEAEEIAQRWFHRELEADYEAHQQHPLGKPFDRETEIEKLERLVAFWSEALTRRPPGASAVFDFFNARRDLSGCDTDINKDPLIGHASFVFAVAEKAACVAKLARARGDWGVHELRLPSPSLLASGRSDEERLEGLLEGASRPFSEFLETYFEKHAKNLGRSSKYAYRLTFERLEALIGPKAIGLVDTRDIARFHASLIDTRSNKGDGFLKHDTIYRSISNIRAFYAWAMSAHYAHDDPARKVIVAADEEGEEKKRRPYTSDELNIIVQSPLFTESGKENDNKRYFILVALFSGMRLSEIKQLEFEDLFMLNGRLHFSVTRTSAHGHVKTTKTQSSMRQVPVHESLKNVGFLDFVNEMRRLSANGRIFPAYRYGNWFNQIFLPDIDLKRPDLVFHSFRHAFRDRLRPAVNLAETVDRIMGHFPAGTGAHYGARDLQPEESAVIEGVEFLGLKIDHLIV